jgi:arsenate reductase-like glutaredoxin family protein
MKFKLPIGDWSGDGHSQCEYYIVEANFTFDMIVEAYIKMDEEYKISEQCSEYEDSRLSEEFIEFLESEGLNPYDYIETKEDPYIETDFLAQLVIDLMMHHDKRLELKIVRDDIPMLNNWAGQELKEKGGHVLSLPGYGLFY